MEAWPDALRFTVEYRRANGLWKECLNEPFHNTLLSAENRKTDGDPSLEYRIVKETTTFEVVG